MGTPPNKQKACGRESLVYNFSLVCPSIFSNGRYSVLFYLHAEFQ